MNFISIFKLDIDFDNFRIYNYTLYFNFYREDLMKGYLKRNYAFIALLCAVLVLCAALLCLTVANPAEAAETFEKDASVSIGHITDTHYYPFRFCYTGDEVTSSESEDFFYNYIMDKSTKMWLEGEMIFDAGLAKFAESAPDYIVLSGDCAQDGELVGHIDIANKLRRLQEYIRTEKNKPDFQIFVVMGNHDLYNPESYRFDNETGTKTAYYYTTRLDAVMVYAGLGYPNMTEEEAEMIYSGFTADELPSGYEYYRSDLSSAFKYSWQFVKDDEEGKTRVFDPAVTAADELTMSAFVSEDMDIVNFNGDSRAIQNSKCYTHEKLDTDLDLGIGEMTFIAARKDGNFTVLGLDVIMSNAVGGHILGGQLVASTQEFLEKNKAFAAPNGAETVVAAIEHHSLLPHWDMEEEITTGFIMYNWEETRDFLADTMGVRYIYTGHQHANDVVAGVSFGGNQIIDMESAAHISVGSQVKITEIEMGAVGTKYAEKAFLSAYQNEKIDKGFEASTIKNNEILAKLFDKVYKDDRYGYVARNRLSEFIDSDNKQIKNYSGYAQRRVYDNIVANYMDKFLKPSITEMLGGLIGNVPIIGSYGKDVVQLANNLISEVNKKVLADYTYSGPTERLKGDDMKVFGFLEELVYDVAYGEVADNTSVFDVFMACYMAHNTGDNWESVEAMPANYQAVLKKVLSGEFVGTLFDKLLSDDKGLMKIIKGLVETELDLSKDLSASFASVLKTIALPMIGVKDADLAHFNLGDALKKAGETDLVKGLIGGLGVEIDLANNTVPEIVDDIVSKYLTDNFKQGLGEYAYNIVTAFGVDGQEQNGHFDYKNTNNGQGYLLTIPGRETDLTFVNNTKEEIITVENGKKPSMLTTNFGSDPKTTQSFTWFTDRRVTDGVIEYTTDLTNHTNVKTKAAKTEIYATTKPLIDLGIWCQSGYVELGRHTVELSDLTPGTTYAYRAGNGDKYWSDWYTFTTATENGSFEALIASDLQASTQSSYQRIDKIYRAVLEQQFKNGLSFMINPGDVVDNGRNLSQYKWLFNSSPDIYASYATVVAAGNHDNKYFTVDKASNSEAYGGVTDGAYGTDGNNENYNYLYSHFNYGLPVDQQQEGGFYYSFDYSGVHFTVLNTNDIDAENKLGEEQYNWLVKDLTDTNKAYKVVLMHKSLYSEGSHSFDKDVVGMRAQLTPLFAEKGVALVIAGHDHTYNETFYLDKDGKKVKTNANGKSEIKNGNGTMYLTMGTMGEKFYNWVENDKVPTNVGTKLHKDKTLSDPTFGKLVFDGEKLYYYGYQYIRETGKIVEIKNGLSAGAIAGIVIACVAAAAGITVAVILIVKKKKAGKNAANAEQPATDTDSGSEDKAE